MRLTDDETAASWSAGVGDVSDFEWDTGNRRKLAKHHVDEHEVVSMFHRPLVFAGRIVEPAHEEPRWLVLGQSERGRKLALVSPGADSGSGRSAVARCGGTRRRSMKKRSPRRKRTAARRGGDAQLAEFERRDLGADIRAARTARVLRPRGRPTSIVLDDDLVRQLRDKGAKRGIGYQTMLKLIVREHLDEY